MPSPECAPWIRSGQPVRPDGVVSAVVLPAAVPAHRLVRRVNDADTVTLVLLAGFAACTGAAVVRAGMAGRAFGPLTAAPVVALPVGGLAFVFPAALMAVLYVSLPLLLVWAGSVAWIAGRGGAARSPLGATAA